LAGLRRLMRVRHPGGRSCDGACRLAWWPRHPASPRLAGLRRLMRVRHPGGRSCDGACRLAWWPRCAGADTLWKPEASFGGACSCCSSFGSTRATSAQKAPGGSRGEWFTRTCGIVPQFALRAVARAQSTRPSGPSAHTKSPRRKPGEWFTRTCGIVPQFALRAVARAQSTRPSGPSAHTKSPRRKPGDTGSHTFPGTMRCGFESENWVPSFGMDGGVVFLPGVPGLPPGASWEDTRATSAQKASGGNRGA
jgi:hypothetical protein